MPQLRNIGDSLRGERIAIEASSIEVNIVARRSHRHRGQFGSMRNNALCVIELPMKWVLEKSEGKKAKRK